ncbi:hypothetical protein JZ751_022127 [Albula glossodonta]|uniref:Uncharacterized protein n=1 Tax=Albula glossodonta TaxID=121402 RepID=A0A8T2NK04_9TELE|nr:hypothetical protein JZ751_022127 [Albula glossodonta]
MSGVLKTGDTVEDVEYMDTFEGHWRWFYQAECGEDETDQPYNWERQTNQTGFTYGEWLQERHGMDLKRKWRR